MKKFGDSVHISQNKFGDFSHFSLHTLNTVLTMARPMTTQDLIAKSHEEEAWKKYREGNQLIPYSEAFNLRLVVE